MITRTERGVCRDLALAGPRPGAAAPPSLEFGSGCRSRHPRARWTHAERHSLCRGCTRFALGCPRKGSRLC